jgi:hypothetical protein
MKIRPVGARRTDGQTDITKVTVAFRNLANAPKMAWRRTNVVATRVGQPVIFAVSGMYRQLGHWILTKSVKEDAACVCFCSMLYLCQLMIGVIPPKQNCFSASQGSSTVTMPNCYGRPIGDNRLNVYIQNCEQFHQHCTITSTTNKRKSIEQ